MSTSSIVVGPEAVTDDSATHRVELRIGGMSCAACASRIERKLNKVAGVTASVNYATEIATIDASSGTALDELRGVVESTGYTAEDARLGRDDADSNYQDERGLWPRLIVGLVAFIPLSDLSIMFAMVPSTRFAYWQWLLSAIALPVVVWCAYPLHRMAWKNARHGAATMDTLVSTGIIAATAWSVYAMFFRSLPPSTGAGVWNAMRSSGAIYLDTGAAITVFVLAGRYFEEKAKRRAGGALRALAALTAREATLLTPDGAEFRIPVRELKVGHRFIVRAGETIPTDGQVETGEASLDMSAMTGESMPVEVAADDCVTGGTRVLSGRLIAQATAVGGDTQLAAMVRLVEQAQTDKASVQRLADRVAGVFVPVVFALALATFTGWLLAGSHVDFAMDSALGVLVIACPCALGLATPTALMVASGRGAQLGIFIKGHRALESSRHIDTVVFDKTGTITSGRMELADLIADPELRDIAAPEILVLAGAVENASEHAVAKAITAAARERSGVLPEVSDYQGLSGLGAVGTVDGHPVRVGRMKMFRDVGTEIPALLAEACRAQEDLGRTAVLASVDGRVCAVLALADTVNDTAAAAIARLHRAGLHTIMLTGDNRSAAQTVAAQVGIDEVIAGVLPTEKVTHLRRLQEQGRRVAMVGDGINDGPALATADLGMAVGVGTDVAIGAADIILVRADLGSVPDALGLARATLRTIRGNLCWAFGYNLAAIPIAAAGFLDPLIAGAAMALSSLFVVSNSLRLRRFGSPGS